MLNGVKRPFGLCIGLLFSMIFGSVVSYSTASEWASDYIASEEIGEARVARDFQEHRDHREPHNNNNSNGGAAKEGVGTPPPPAQPPTGISNLDGEPTATAGAGVNVISGDYNEGGVDLILPGAQPISLVRAYCSGQHSHTSFHCLWNLSHCDTIERNFIDGSHYLVEGCGAKFLFKHAHLDESMLTKGLTNTGSGMLSARTNMKNLSVAPYNDSVRTVVDGSGTIRYFKKEGSHLPHGEILRVIKRKNPSGMCLSYAYDDEHFLRRIKARNRTGDELGFISIDHPNKEYFKENPRLVAYSTDNRHVEYLFNKEGSHFFLSDVKASDAPPIHYSYTHEKDRKLSKKSWPNSRYVETQYYHIGHNHVADRTINVPCPLHPLLGRVKLQRAPVGTTAEPITTHRFVYHLNHNCNIGPNNFNSNKDLSGSCDVTDALGHLTQYVWDKKERLTEVIRCDKEHRPYTIEKVFWGSGKEEGNMVGRALISPSSSRVMMARSLYYDERGNVVKEMLSGNLSGECDVAVQLDNTGRAKDNGCDSYEVRYSYEDSPFNLMKKESDSRKSVSYEYVPNSDLVAAKFVRPAGGGAIALRQFYRYDDNAIVVKEIIDDGSSRDKDDLTGVTRRLIKRIIPRACQPVGLPQEVVESYVDIGSGKEKQLHRTVNHYNGIGGRLTRQEHFDSNDIFMYALEWQYDAYGNVSAISDALGLTTERRYDANCNLIWEQGPCKSLHKEYIYDFANRLIGEEEVHSDGNRLVQSYSYDLLGRRTDSIDIYGNTTRCSYDEHGRCVEVTLPRVQDGEGHSTHPRYTTQYDRISQPIVQSNAMSYETRSQYNVRGQPTAISYPDGTVAKMTYNLDGSLKWQQAPDGSSTFFQYDYQLRPILKEEKDAAGALIKRTTYSYDAFNLLKECDSTGHSTSYRYDGAGRLIEQVCDGQKTTFSYDSWGRQYRSKVFFGEGSRDFIAQIKLFNSLGQLIEELSQDDQGALQSKVCYGYDTYGRKSTVTTFNEAGASTSTTEYDIRGEPCRWIDPKGYSSHKIVFYNFVNKLGQRVRYEELTDAMGFTSCYEYDALGRLVSTKGRALWGGIISDSRSYYDLEGNLLKKIDIAFDPATGDKLRSATTCWTYDSMGKVTALMEAADSVQERKTKIIYDNRGKKQVIIYPDGIALNFQYDAAGRLSRRFSSDGSVHDGFVYDSAGRVVEAIDKKEGITTSRSYSVNGALTEEILGNGLKMHYESDKIQRPVTVTLPDKSSIKYTYRGGLLAAIDRFGDDASHRYTHSYMSYDLSGNVVSAATADGATASWQYDSLGRITRIEMPGWQQAAADYDGAGNLRGKYTADPLYGGFITTYSYDYLQQLDCEVGVFNSRYRLDSLYNRVERDGVAAKFSDTHELLKDGVARYSYDMRGNLIKEVALGDSSDVTSYDYDALNRLVSVTAGSVRTTYGYDPFHRRITKTHWNNGDGVWRAWKCERILFQGDNDIGTFNTLGRARSLRILGINQGGAAEIGAAVAVELSGKIYIPVHDLQGNISCLIDKESGAAAVTYRYSAYGEMQQTVVDSVVEVNPWHWKSKRLDPETGWHFFGRRYYSAQAARWTTPDPLGYEVGPNLYAYACNRPFSLQDPYGLMPIELQSGSKASGSSGSGGSSGGAGRPSESAPVRTNLLVDLARGGVHFLAKGVECIGKHIVGLPYIRDPLCFVGHVLQGKQPKDYEASWNMPPSCYYFVGNWLDPDNIRGYINGICTSWQVAENRGMQASMELGGRYVAICYNNSYGLLWDLAFVALHKLGFCTKATHALRDFLNYAKYVMNPGCRVTLSPHSHGGVITYDQHSHVNKDFLLASVEVQSYGSATTIPDGIFKKVVNNVSPFDPVPAIGDFIRYSIARFCHATGRETNMNVLPTKGFKFFDHSFEGETYQGKYRKEFDKYKESLGL